MEVVKGLFLYRVDGQRTGLAIDLTDEHAIKVPATTTASRPSVSYATVMRTEMALHPAVIKLLIVSALKYHAGAISMMILRYDVRLNVP
jgi:hypothetical protein